MAHLQNRSLRCNRVRVTILFGFICSFYFAFSQRAHTVSLFYPAFEEFSFDQRIAKTLTPGFTDVEFQRGKFHYRFGQFPARVTPYAFGFSYRYLRTNGEGWQAFGYYQDLYTDFRSIIGQTMWMPNFVFGGGRVQRLWSSTNNGLILSGLLLGQLRLGKDTYWINYAGWVDLFPYRPLRDFGVDIGLQGTWYPLSRLGISAELGYTRWLFLYSNIVERRYLNSGYYPLKPWNQIDMKVSIGFCFGKELGPGFESQQN